MSAAPAISSRKAKLGHTVIFCENGEQTVQAAGRGTFDVVLLDLHMPVMGGFDAIRLIRQLSGADQARCAPNLSCKA